MQCAQSAGRARSVSRTGHPGLVWLRRKEHAHADIGGSGLNVQPPVHRRKAVQDVIIFHSWADVAQLVEQSIRNRQVIGSSPIVGSIHFAHRTSNFRCVRSAEFGEH